MLLRDLLKKTEIITAAADVNIDIKSICYDTRKLRDGDLFIAIRGYEHDGHAFIEEAVRKGAACVVCEEMPTTKTPHILVKDSRKALAGISAAWFGHPASKLKIIGVTGTNGKTTVTNLIKQTIERCLHEKVGMIGTNGNMIGNMEFIAERTTPESYEIHELLSKMVDEGCAYAVLEISSHALALNRVFGIEYEVGVFTNLTPDHMDFHESMDDYARVKSQMFPNCRNAAINIDDPYALKMISNTSGTVYTYAVNNGAADFVAKNIRYSADKVDFCVLQIGSLNRIELPLPGLFSVYNALAAISAMMFLGLEIEQVAEALEHCSSVKGRMEVVPTDTQYTVMIDYAHTPDALRNVLSTVRGFARERVVVLFGCGGDRDKTKRPQMGAIAVKLADYVIVTSDNPRTEEPGAIIKDILAGMGKTKTPYKVIENRREAIHWALGNAEPRDVIILAGKGHETYQVIGKEKNHFDEREVIAEFFAK